MTSLVCFNTKSLEYQFELEFLCVLCRLQQLPAQAVLARLHGMLSRCCRWDLLLLSQVLKCTRCDSNEEQPESDVLFALGQRVVPVADDISALTRKQRRIRISCINVLLPATNDLNISKSVGLALWQQLVIRTLHSLHNCGVPYKDVEKLIHSLHPFIGTLCCHMMISS